MAHGTYALQSMAVRTPIEMVVSRRDVQDIITSNLRGALAATVANTLTSHIGQGMHPAGGEPPRIDPVTHKILHALTGAGTAGITGGDMLSGAFGAVVGEIAGEIYRSTGMAHLTPGTDAWNRAAETGASVAQMIAATAAMALDLEADTAANAADTATRNNCFEPFGPLYPDAEANRQQDEINMEVSRAAFETVTTPLPEDYQDFVVPWNQAMDTTEALATQVRDALKGTPAMGFVSAIAPGAPLVLEGLPLIAGALHAPKTYLELATLAPVGKVARVGTKMGAKVFQKTASSLVKEGGARISTHVLERAIASKTGTPVASLGMHTATDLAASRFARGETSSVTKYFGKKSTSHQGHAASSGVTAYGPIAGTLTRVGGDVATSRTVRPLLPNEGAVDTYGALTKIGKKGDNLAAHHMPNDNYMRAHGVKRNDGIAMLVEHPTPGTGGRHREIHKTLPKQDPSLPPRDALAQSVNTAREKYKDSGTYTSEVRKKLLDVINENKETFPHMFKGKKQ